MVVSFFIADEVIQISSLFPYSVQMVPQTVIYFTVYDQLKVRFGYVDGQTSILAPLAAGVMSRCMLFTLV